MFVKYFSMVIMNDIRFCGVLENIYFMFFIMMNFKTPQNNDEGDMNNR